MVDVGSVLLGRYKLNARVGAGGMATVYDGEDLLLGRRVAIKVPLPALAADPTFLARFENEARAAAAVTHPHLVAVYDVGEDAGARFIVLEFVEGETLKERLRRTGALPPAVVAQLGSQLADALEAAHQRGLVHRDVKPQNILLTPDGRAKLGDFGIALALGADPATRTGVVLGSVHYMAPEVARGEGATPLADIYALGVVLYEASTGVVPYEGDNPFAIALQHLQAPPRRPRDLNPGVPPALEAIILRAMAKVPAERFPSAGALAQALRACARGEPAPAAAAAEPAPPPDQAPTRPWTWEQPAVTSPWAASQAAPAGAAPAPGPRPVPVRPYPASAAPPWEATPPPYPSARWPLVLLGLVSLLCVLGLVPMGMLAYRQLRLPPTPPRVAPAGDLAPARGVGALGAVQALPGWWAATARALVPVPGADGTPADTGLPALVTRGAALLSAALQRTTATLARPFVAATCAAASDAGAPPSSSDACDAPAAPPDRPAPAID